MKQYPKRLIEVDLPIARISAHARREKDMRKCHIPSLHIYPAARPPAACRAVICASLWPDPADELCPKSFRETAVEQIKAFAAKAAHAFLVGDDRPKLNKELKNIDAGLSPESRARWEAIASGSLSLDAEQEADWGILRLCLLDFIADFANWDNCTVSAYLETSRALTQASHESLGGTPGTRPLVVDPFAGGGAIPLEALRAGADAFASDLNPVSVLLNKVVLEYIPKYGQRLADEVRKWGQRAKNDAEKELGQFYPTDPDGSIPIAYLWARTIRCEGPSCGAVVPLMRSFWLAKKGQKVALCLKVDSVNKTLGFSVSENPNVSDIPKATSTRGAATCPCCGYTTPVESVRSQLGEREGGSDDAQLFVVVIDDPNKKARRFRLPNENDIRAVASARKRLEEISSSSGLSLYPTEELPPEGAIGFRVQKYGMSKWHHLFNARQLLALTTYARLSREYAKSLSDESFGEAVNACLALLVDRLADLNAAMCVWQLNTRNTAHVFGRWALPMSWDYGEVNPLAGAGGSPESAISRMARSIEDLTAANLERGHVEQSSADKHPLPDDSVSVFFTDPPYYDAMPYSDLLDFFYVWMKRTLGDSFRMLINEELGPKEKECIVDKSKGKDQAYYESAMTDAMAEGRRVLSPSGIGIVVFAHKSTSGWEAQLQSMIDAGWIISASWPIDTEMGSRLRAKSSAALASSVHLVCRPRENPDGSLREEVGEWRDVLSELPGRIHEWMPRLAAEGVVGADAIFACLGPALEIFSRYSRVEKASGEAVPLREYLEQVWSAVSTEALSMIFKDADAAGLEPDARITAMWLWTLGAGKDENGKKKDGNGEKVVASTGYTLEFDAARKIAQGLGINLEKSESIVEVKGDKARLLPVSERTRYLFGKEEATATTARGRKKKKNPQRSLFEELDEWEADAENQPGGELKPQAGETVLDRVHQSMILFAAGRGEALRRFLIEDGAGTDARFWKLAQSLSALYPKETDEKRWVDGVLARKKGLGL